MAPFLPEHIELTTAEAVSMLVALDTAHELLQQGPMLGALLDIEDAQALLVDKLFPEEEA